MKRVRLHKIQYCPVHDRPQRLHQVEDQRRPVHIVRVKKTYCRIVTFRNDLRADLAFKHRIGVSSKSRSPDARQIGFFPSSSCLATVVGRPDTSLPGSGDGLYPSSAEAKIAMQ
jgi:hypothetical protein